MPDTPPKNLGKYEVTDLLGQGAMGVVYRALDPVLSRYVAIKVMNQGIAADQELRNRFMREARAAGSLQHPNIITIYDFGETEGYLYIAMEYVEGSDLSEIMDRRDPMPVWGKLDIVVDALHALDYAHSRGVVHRDVKPANIRVSVNGHAKLMDFGIARLEKSDLTRSGVMIGTPDYMAPEQVTGGEITSATDVFAMGVVLYEFLTARRTFDGDTLHAVLYKVVHDQPPPMHEVSAAVPASLQPIVDRALAKDPAQRYPTAGAMARDLEVARAALSQGATVRVTARATPLRTARMTKPLPLSKKARTRRRVMIGVGAGVVVLVGAAAALVIGGRQHRAGPSAASPIAASSPAAGTATQPAAGPTSPQPGEHEAAGTPATGSSGPSAPTAPAPSAAPETRMAAAARPTPTPVVRKGQGAPPPPSPSAPVLVSEPAASPAAQPAAPVTQAAAAPSPVPPTPQPAASAVTQAVPAPAPEAPEPAPDARPQIEELIAAYARAIEARNIGEIRRLYPSLTSDQQRDWEQFFHAARNVRAQLTVTRLDVNGAAADVTVGGSLEYDTGNGTQHQPMSFHASAALENGVWRLRSVR